MLKVTGLRRNLRSNLAFMPKNLFKFLPYFLKIRPMFIYVSTLSLKLNKATIRKLCCRPFRPLTNEDFPKLGKRQDNENASFVEYIYDESVHQLDNEIIEAFGKSM